MASKFKSHIYKVGELESNFFSSGPTHFGGALMLSTALDSAVARMNPL